MWELLIFVCVHTASGDLCFPQAPLSAKSEDHCVFMTEPASEFAGQIAESHGMDVYMVLGHCQPVQTDT